MARTPAAKRKPLPPVAEATALRILSEIFDRLRDPDQKRALPYYRQHELCPPFTKSYVFERLKDGTLEAVKVGGLLLITETSVRRLLDSAVPWTPGNGRGAARRKP